MTNQPARKRKPKAKPAPEPTIDVTATDVEAPAEPAKDTETVEEPKQLTFLEEKHAEIKARMEELRPHVEEFNKLIAADRALSGEPNRGGRPRSA